jgi:hypothetical protein
MCQVHDKAAVKTKKSLNLQLKDMNHKRVLTDSKVLQEKALSHYMQLKLPAVEGQASDEKEFKASQGWLNSFRNHFNLKLMQLTGESASTNEEAVKAHPEKLKKIADEAGYCLAQVFNADKTWFFLKKMFNHTYISKSERQAPGMRLFCFVAMLLGI